MQQDILDYYNHLAADYDEDRFAGSYGRFLHQQEDRLLRQWGFSSLDAPCLSIGCGTGRFMSYATHGTDLSPAMIEQARQQYPDKSFAVADASQLPYEDTSFKRIFSLHLFMHLDSEKVDAIVQEAHRILEPGGQFVFDLPSAARRRLSGHRQSGWHGNNAYTPAEVRELLTDGWVIEAIRGVLFLPIHRLPQSWRMRFLSIDNLLGDSPLWPYASYWMINARRL